MYHTYPYKAQIPILIDGKHQTRMFTSKKDVDDVIELLIEEVNEVKDDVLKIALQSLGANILAKSSNEEELK